MSSTRATFVTPSPSSRRTPLYRSSQRNGQTKANATNDIPQGFSGLRDMATKKTKAVLGEKTERSEKRLEERISSGEFSKKSMNEKTKAWRKSLSQLGPIGRFLAYQLAQLSRKDRSAIPEATGSLSEMMGGPFFEPLYELFLVYGGIFRLSFGPQSFIIVSDPGMAREMLSVSPDKFSKGILADILEFVMGNGLIPADGEIWLKRRRAIMPSMHRAYIENMVHTFADCTDRGLDVIRESIKNGESVEVEGLFSRIALDIIGKAVFDYDFDATTHDDPVIKAVYAVLREAELRSLSPFPWWNLPLVDVLVPQQRRVKEALGIINDTLNRLVQNVQDVIEEDKSFDTSSLSILHFLLASGEEVSTKQLRDDLMTLLIAGHETTAAVLTWMFYELSSKPYLVKAMQKEIDEVIGDKPVSSSSLFRLDLCTRTIAETLRLYPQPPVLIRKTLEPVQLGGYEVPEGQDIFLSTWNLHRSPQQWENPISFNPDRFPKNGGMPSEISTGFRYLPFGGGKRKCIGAQFALLESLEIVASILQKYDFEMPDDAPPIEMTTGATIHSKHGIYLRFSERKPKLDEEVGALTKDMSPC